MEASGMKLCSSALIVVVFLLAAGCAGPAVRSQSPEDTAAALESQTRLIGEYAAPYGMNYVKVESVGLVTGLAGTGSDPAPSPLRAALEAEMRTRGVTNTGAVLASPNTSLVVVRGYLPPGVQKGDPFDVEVLLPAQSETTSLRGGWLMENRLGESAMIGGRIREGSLLALAQGAIMVDPSAKGEEDRPLLTKGVVLGGGTALKSRTLGLVLPDDKKSVRTSAQIGAAINKRFHSFEHGIKQGVATPKTDEYIELTVHPRYKDNLARYMRVVRSVATFETASQQVQRIELLDRQLHDPVTSSMAAIRLEAIGKEGVRVLKKGLDDSDAEVQFYSAESLAYLDQDVAAKPLEDAARNVPAFRAYALTALSAMEDVAAKDALRELLDVPSAETRYGAFRALKSMKNKDPVVQGEKLGGKFEYHVLATNGPPMVHLTRSQRPEIVLFGQDQRLQSPFILEAGHQITVNATGETVTISKFAVGEPDQKRVVTTKLDEVIRAIVDLGGAYPDLVLALEQAKATKALLGRLEIDAVPTRDRTFDRPEDDSLNDAAGKDKLEVASPKGDLFSQGPKKK
jgi:flagellar basal body P-ring protein FlgI